MTTSPENDQRIEARLELEETIFIEVLSSSADRTQPGSVILSNSLDLSANGLQVVVDEPISAGSIMRIAVDRRDEDPIYLVGEVKWGRPDPNGGFRIGFLLLESAETDIDRWKRVVAALLGS